MSPAVTNQKEEGHLAPSAWVPVPDPTKLTNDLVEKAVTNLREILETRIKAIEHSIVITEANLTRHGDITGNTLQEILNAKIIANKEVIQVIRDDIEKRFQVAAEEQRKNARDIKEAVDTAFASNTVVTNVGQNLQDEKIRSLTETVTVFKTSVNERFQLGDVQTEKAARDVKSAVDAAFAAAKEAVGEQNKSNALSIAKSEVATTKQIDQLAENARVSAKNADDKISDLKDRLVAMEGKSTGSNQALGWGIGAAGVLIAIIAVLFDVARLSGH